MLLTFIGTESILALRARRNIGISYGVNWVACDVG